jgi:inosine-uridine nucleoside N-ribohydrolase
MAGSTMQTEFMRVDIETTSLLAAGQTVCDVWGQSNRQKNVHVAKVYNELDPIHTCVCRAGSRIPPSPSTLI